MTKLNARSPYYIKVEDSSLSYAIMELYVYTGIYGYDKGSPKYTIRKDVISTNDYIVFEISELVRDYLDTTFGVGLQDYVGQNVWVEADIVEYDSSDVPIGATNPADRYEARILADGGTFVASSCLQSYFDEITPPDLIAFDGYSYFEDGANAQLSRTLLQSNTDIYHLSGEELRIPVYSEDVTSVVFYYQGSIVSTVSTPTSGLSYEQTVYASYTGDVDEVRVNSSGVEIINVYETDECRYTPYKVTFVNKYGALQDVWFFKKSTESLNTKSENYKSNTFNQSTLTYDIPNHQYRDFHKEGKESITMNTGFVSEEYNKVMKELLLSEKVWLTKTIDATETILPITVKTQSLQYKTSVNDKLINYTIDFDYAFDKINNIR